MRLIACRCGFRTGVPRRVTQGLLFMPLEQMNSILTQAPEKESNGRPKWRARHPRANHAWASGAHIHVATCARGFTEGFGVPPGSPFSGIASQAVLRPVLEAIENAAEGVEAGFYADNLIILLPDASAKNAVVKALMEAVRDVIRDESQAGLRERVVAWPPSVSCLLVT